MKMKTFIMVAGLGLASISQGLTLNCVDKDQGSLTLIFTKTAEGSGAFYLDKPGAVHGFISGSYKAQVITAMTRLKGYTQITASAKATPARYLPAAGDPVGASVQLIKDPNAYNGVQHAFGSIYTSEYGAQGQKLYLVSCVSQPES